MATYARSRHPLVLSYVPRIQALEHGARGLMEQARQGGDGTLANRDDVNG